MKRIVTVVAPVAAALAASGVLAAAAAAAPPQYVGCVKAAKSGKTYTGAYVNKTCSEASVGHDGKYELGAAKLPAKVKGTAGKIDIYLYNPETKAIEGHFECSSGKESGEITGASTGTLSVSYSLCRATGQLAGPCNSPGQKSGVVVSEPLQTNLVWLNEAETQPGIEVSPVSASEITKVVCAGGAETAELTGAMLGTVSPTSEASKAQTISFAADPSTGAPEFTGSWEEGAFRAQPLVSNLRGLKEYEGVPSAQNSVFTQKGPAVLIGA
jgi:hypothetical protein